MNRNAKPLARRQQRGVTLVEAAVTIGVLAVIAGIAAPSFNAAIERRTIEGVATELETDIQYARSAAAARSQSVRMRFQTHAQGTCYVLHTGAANSCSCQADGTAQCESPDQALKVAFVPAGKRVALQSNAGSMTFDAGRNTVTPAGTVKVIGTEGRALHQIVNIVGRVRTCSPNKSISGYRTCS